MFEKIGKKNGNNYWQVIFAIIIFGISVVLEYKYKDGWHVGLVGIFLLILLNIKQIIEGIEILKVGKDGVELKRITENARETLKELKGLAILFSKNLSRLVTGIGRFGTALDIKEFYEYKLEMEKLLSVLDIDDKDKKGSIYLIDNFILFEILDLTVKKFNGTSKVNIFQEIHKFTENPNSKIYSPDIDAIEECLKKHEQLTEDNLKLLTVARYFKEHKQLSEEFLRNLGVEI